jgi:hypothetical protein
MSVSLPTTHPHIVMTEFDGGESVLVDLDTRRYYQLNETATVIWRALSDRRSKPEIVASLTSVYDVTPDDADQSIELVIENLKAHHLVVTS